MQEFFSKQKEKISEFLTRFLEQKQEDLSRVRGPGKDACARLKVFALKGKMLRGGLAALGYSLFKKAIPEAVTAGGAALELLQAGLLIHDDIMDRDLSRRGDASIFYQYAVMAKKENMREALHIGESLGICAGDLGFFLAFELLSALHVAHRVKTRLAALFSSELSLVAAAQMQDVYWGGASKPGLSEAGIFNLYTYKTGRYSFSLPLTCGALLARAGEEQIDRIRRIGELLGIIFQIKDDELGMFGEEEEIGKPVGSDIKAGKKNLYYFYLSQAGTGQKGKDLLALFHRQELGPGELKEIRKAVIDLGIQDKIRVRVEELAAEAAPLMENLSGCRAQAREILFELLKYNLGRIS